MSQSITAETALRGLTSAEVAERVGRGETNAVKFETSRSYGRIVFDNAANPVNVILFSISILLVAVGLLGDAVLTAGLVLGNVVVGIFQEARAKRQLDRVALLTRPSATVIRDGEEQTIAPDEVVLGDVAIVRAGDQVLADGLLLQEQSLSVDESLLTGESDFVRKRSGDELHSGTFVMTGSGIFEVQQVGVERLAQKITEKARTFRNVRTPLQREVGYIIWASAIIVALLGIEVLDTFRDIYGRVPLVEGARAAAVIVALVPQGLWFMITITYAMAIVRMARTGALIQRMNAVESLSHVDVLCFDKTGTLTTNSLNLESVHPVGGIDEGELRRRLGRFAASASFSNRTNEAIIAGCPAQPLAARDEVVFDSSRKWSALIFDGPDVEMHGVYVLGAPEVISPHLGAADGLPAIDAWTSRGLRVLVFAWHQNGSHIFDERSPTLPATLQALGLVVLSDQLRQEAARTIADFRKAGIGLKIISGDHPETVTALARQAGFGDGLKMVSGIELDELADADWPRVVQEATIFGRITPEQKERLVRTLQKNGHYVAMMGDGVNDVPSLKAANVAVSLRSASPVTRNVADIVLLGDSFSVLPAAFIEGRRIRNGMVGIIKLFLVRVLSVMLVILGAALLSEPFPVTPRHTALIALLTVGIPTLGLATWARPGRTERYLLPMIADFVLPAALTLGLVCLAVFVCYLTLGIEVEKARTVLTTTAVLCGIMLIPYAGHAPNDWLRRDILLNELRNLALSGAMLLLFVVAWARPFLRRFYELDVMSVFDWPVVLIAVAGWAWLLREIWRREPPNLVGRWLGRVLH